MPIIVKNINGTSGNSCKCGSWLNHWEKLSRTSPRWCAQVACMKEAKHGAHVLRADSVISKWFIIPLCEAHNAQRGEQLYVMDSTIFISANKKETCENS